MTVLRALALAFALALGSTAAWAQGADDEPLINFVFATQLGSGVYTAGDRVIQVYRIPVSYTLRSVDDHPWGVRLRFPVTVGFYDFRPRDIFEGELPDDVATTTLMAGAEFPVRVAPGWILAPVAEIGYGRDHSQDVGSAVYAVGLVTDGEIEDGRSTWLLQNRLIWTGQSDAKSILSADLLRLQTAVELRRPLADVGRRKMDIGVYAASDLYFDTVDFFRFPRDINVASVDEIPQDVFVAQWELGVTFGVTPKKLGPFPVPRFGLGYRFGDDLSAVRFVLGGVF